MEIYSNLDLSNLDAAQETVKTKIGQIEYDPSAIEMTREEYNTMSREILSDLKEMNFDIRNSKNSQLTDRPCFPILVDVMSAIERFEGVGELNASLDSLENITNLTLSCDDKSIVIGTIKIARSSAYLWSDESMGGLGLLDNSLNRQKFHALASWKKVLKIAIVADASSLSASFIKYGTALALGLEVPGANLAILTGLALDAIYGSGIGAIVGLASIR